MPPQKVVRGVQYQKVQPKLRVLANGSSKVNEIRSEVVGCISSGKKHAPTVQAGKPMVQQQLAVSFSSLPKAARKKPKHKEAPTEIKASVFVQLRSPANGAKVL